MSECSCEIKVLAADEVVEFTFPDGFKQAAHSLQFLPDDETREAMLMGLVQGMALM